MPGICLNAEPPISELSISMFAVTAPCTSRIAPSPRQPGGGAGVCSGSTSEAVRGVFDAACEGLCRCASLVLIVALLFSGVDGASCAPAFQADMPNDRTTVVGWVVGDVPVVDGVPTPGWHLKVIMEDQCGVHVVDQPGCGMVRGGQSRVNMFLTTRGITDELKQVVSDGLQPATLKSGKDTVVWGQVSRVWEKLERDPRFHRVPMQLHGLQGSSVVDVGEYVKAILATAKDGSGDSMEMEGCKDRDVVLGQVVRALGGGEFSVSQAPYVSREAGGVVYEVFLPSKEMMRWFYWQSCVQGVGVQIDGKCVIPTPLVPRVAHTPEEYQAMRGGGSSS